ncbi:MAG: class I SAM-dependent methyltransferase [Candidatus Levyibacteriota bacterium]
MIGNQSSNFLKHTTKNPVQKFLIKNFYQALFSLVKPLNPKTILDVGCGEGFTLNEFLINNVGKKLEGVDNSHNSLSIGAELFPNLSLKYADIYKLPYKDNSFDLVLCLEVMEHLKEPKKAISEIMRVSKKYTIISVPNEPFFRISNFLRGKNVKRLGNDEGHINHWNLSTFKQLMQKQNLIVQNSKSPFPWVMILVEK